MTVVSILIDSYRWMILRGSGELFSCRLSGLRLLGLALPRTQILTGFLTSTTQVTPGTHLNSAAVVGIEEPWMHG